MTAADPRRRADRYWPVVLIVFSLLGLVGLINHEIWRDEAEIWLIARDSGTLSELFVNMGTQGHPAVWYLLAFALTRLSSNPLAMQLLNLLIGTLAVLLFFRYAPFTLLQRILFCFGYYALYEFTVISRSYGLQNLLAFAACALLARGKRFGPGVAALIVLLANTTLYGTIIASQITLLAILRVLDDRRAGRRGWDRRALGSISVMLAGVSVGFAHVLAQSLAIGPDHAGAYAPGWDLPWVLAALSTISYGFLPLADPTTLHSWNSNLLSVLPTGWAAWVGATLGVALFAGCAYCLRRRGAILGVFLTGSAAMLGIVFFVWYGSQRHHGQIFLWFLVCYWLWAGLRERGAGERPATGSAQRCGIGLTSILTLQVVACAYAYSMDLRHPFSKAREVGEFLGGGEYDDVVILGSRDYAVEPVTAFMDRPVYYPESERFGTFVDWSSRRRLVPLERVLESAVELRQREQRDVIVVLSYPTTLALGKRVALGEGNTMHHFARFEGAIVPDENYRLFRVGPAPAE